MTAVLVSWIYMEIICMLAGAGVFGVIQKVLPVAKAKSSGETQFSPAYCLAAGTIIITVYTEIYSIFGKIGILAHMLFLAAVLTAGVLCRKSILEIWKRYKRIVCSWEGFFYICFILLIAFFTSRGTFHTDTNIYHAQAIHFYEEYGLIKGMGNLQLHYAYNSAYLAFASFFSFHWLIGQSLHTATGFIEVMMCIYAFHGLKDFKDHEKHAADMMRIGIIFYALVMLTGSMSPATDYATVLFTLFVLTAWCENMERERSILAYGLLSVAAVFVVTLKFSACLLALLAVYPAVYLVKEKRWKEIGVYLGCGLIIILPFLIRNFLISGWLLYPFKGIDIFQVEWKIPEEYLTVDADQIKVWGRCLYDVSKVNLPVSKWLPVWWEGQERYEQMLIGSVVIGLLLIAVQFIAGRIRHKKIQWDYLTLVLVVLGCLTVWFLMAPFIRYGIAFLFAVPMLAAGRYLSEKKSGFYSILTGSLVFCIVVSMSPYWDNYITDAGVFIKQNLTQPYYICQKDYDQTETESCEINGNIFYYPKQGEINSYHAFPGTCYAFMIERSTLMGDDIKDGFKPK